MRRTPSHSLFPARAGSSRALTADNKGLGYSPSSNLFNWSLSSERYRDLLDWNGIHYVVGTIPYANFTTAPCFPAHSAYAHGSAFVHNTTTAYERYLTDLVVRTRAADPNRGRTKVLFYIHTQISTEPNASVRYADSRVLGPDGKQRAYSQCTTASGEPQPLYPLFFADGSNSYTEQMEAYVEKAFELGATGLYHVRWTVSSCVHVYR